MPGGAGVVTCGGEAAPAGLTWMWPKDQYAQPPDQVNYSLVVMYATWHGRPARGFLGLTFRGW